MAFDMSVFDSMQPEQAKNSEAKAGTGYDMSVFDIRPGPRNEMPQYGGEAIPNDQAAVAKQLRDAGLPIPDQDPAGSWNRRSTMQKVFGTTEDWAQRGTELAATMGEGAFNALSLGAGLIDMVTPGESIKPYFQAKAEEMAKARAKASSGEFMDYVTEGVGALPMLMAGAGAIGNTINKVASLTPEVLAGLSMTQRAALSATTLAGASGLTAPDGSRLQSTAIGGAMGSVMPAIEAIPNELLRRGVGAGVFGGISKLLGAEGGQVAADSLLGGVLMRRGSGDGELTTDVNRTESIPLEPKVVIARIERDHPIFANEQRARFMADPVNIEMLDADPEAAQLSWHQHLLQAAANELVTTDVNSVRKSDGVTAPEEYTPKIVEFARDLRKAMPNADPVAIDAAVWAVAKPVFEHLAVKRGLSLDEFMSKHIVGVTNEPVPKGALEQPSISEAFAKQKKSPHLWEVSKTEFDDNYAGKGQAVVVMEDGKVFTGQDHGHALMNAEDAGYSVPAEKLGTISGWKFGRDIVKTSEFPGLNISELHKAVVERALASGEPVSAKAIVEYPDLQAKFPDLAKQMSKSPYERIRDAYLKLRDPEFKDADIAKIKAEARVSQEDLESVLSNLGHYGNATFAKTDDPYLSPADKASAIILNGEPVHRMTFVGDPTPPKAFAQRAKKGVVSAAVSFEDGKALLHAFKTFDASSLIHETGHILRRFLDRPVQDIIEKWAEVKKGDAWTRDQEERFAKAFENYIYRDVKPDTGPMRMAFRKLRDALGSIYRFFRGMPDVEFSQEVKDALDPIFKDTPEKRAANVKALEAKKLVKPAEVRAIEDFLGKTTTKSGKEIPYTPDISVEEANLRAADAIAKDFSKVEGAVLDTLKGGRGVDSSQQQVEAQQLMEARGPSALESGSTEDIGKVFDLSMAEVIGGSKAGRQLRMMQGSPLQMLLKTIFRPDRKISQAMEKALAAGERGKYEELKAVEVERIKDIQFDLKASGLDLKSLTPEQRNDIATLAHISRVIARNRATFGNVLQEAFIGSLMSSLKSLNTNVLGVTKQAAYDVCMRMPIEAMLNTVLWHRADLLRVSDVVPMVRAALTAALPFAGRQMMMAFRTGTPDFELTAVGRDKILPFAGNMNRAISGALLNRQARVMRKYPVISAGIRGVQKVLDTAGILVRFAPTTNMATETFINAFYTRMRVAVEAEKLIRSRLKTGIVKPADASKALAALIDSPKSFAWQNAVDHLIEDVNFHRAPTGPVQSITKLRHTVPGLFFQIPFVNFMLRSVGSGLRTSPLGSIALAVRSIRAAIPESAALPAKVRAWIPTFGLHKDLPMEKFNQHLAEQIVAWGVMTGAANFFMKRDDGREPIVTGSSVRLPRPLENGPEAQVETMMASTRQPYTIDVSSLPWIGPVVEKWLGHSQLDYSQVMPFNTQLAATVDTYQALFEAKTEKDFQQRAVELYHHTAVNVANGTFIRNLCDLVSGLSDPERIPDWAGGLTLGFIPNYWKSAAKASDPYVREMGKFGLTEEDLLQDSKERAQYLAYPDGKDSVMFPKVDIFGKEMTKGVTMKPQSDFWLKLLAPGNIFESYKPDSTEALVTGLVLNYNDAHPKQPKFFSPPSHYLTVSIPGSQAVKVPMNREEYHEMTMRAGEFFTRMATGLLRPDPASGKRALSVNEPTYEIDIKALEEAYSSAVTAARGLAMKRKDQTDPGWQDKVMAEVKAMAARNKDRRVN